MDSSYSVWWWDGSFVTFLFPLLLKSLSDFTELFWTLFYLMLRLLNRFPRFRYFVCYVDMFCPMTWYSVKEHVRDLRWILFVYLAIYMCFFNYFLKCTCCWCIGDKTSVCCTRTIPWLDLLIVSLGSADLRNIQCTLHDSKLCTITLRDLWSNLRSSFRRALLSILLLRIFLHTVFACSLGNTRHDCCESNPHPFFL